MGVAIEFSCEQIPVGGNPWQFDITKLYKCYFIVLLWKTNLYLGNIAHTSVKMNKN